MATKIIEYDTLIRPDLPSDGWPGYKSVLILFRRGPHTLGVRKLPLSGGQVDRFQFERAVDNAIRKRIDLLIRERYGATPATEEDIKISVVICSRDRASHLERCLAALDACDPQPWEVLVIDNASADDSTERVAASHGVRCEREDRPGLNWARARGAARARGEIVAYIDDDVIVHTDWLLPFPKAFSDPSLAALTGLILPNELDSPSAELFENYCGFVRGYEHRTMKIPSFKPLAAANAGAGACMAFRRRIVNELRLFNVEIDAGTKARTGGDTYAFYRLISLGYRIDYDPDVVVRHQHRENTEAVVSTLRDYSLGTYVFFLHCLLRHGEIGALRAGLSWFRTHHLRQLYRGLRGRPRAQPLKMTLAEISGCLAAPLAYLGTRWNDRRPYPQVEKQLEPGIGP